MMGYELRRALREVLGSEITGLQRAVALEIADDANDDTRLSYVTLEKLVQWTAAKDVNVVRNALKRLAAAGVEFRVPLGKGKDGRVLFAVPGKRLTFRVPEIEGVATAPPSDGLPGAHPFEGVATAPTEGVTATPWVAEGVAVATTERAGATAGGAVATPFSSIPHVPSSSPLDLVRAGGALKPGDDEEEFIRWMNGKFRPKSIKWWHKLIANGDLSLRVDEWRAERAPAPSAIGAPSAATRGPEARPVAETLAQLWPAAESHVPSDGDSSGLAEYLASRQKHVPRKSSSADDGAGEPAFAVQPQLDEQLGDDDPDELVEF